MELKEVIEKRASIRSFSNETIPEEHINEIVRLAGLAPSINNSQPWKFTVVTKRELLQKMAATVIQSINEIPSNQSRLAKNIKSQVAWYSSFFEEAPVVLALATEPYESVLSKGVSISNLEINEIRNHPDIQSAGACIQNLLLAAVDLGYGACWLSGPLFARKKLEELLKIEAPWKLITFVALGKPKATVKNKSKKNIAEEIVWIK